MTVHFEVILGLHKHRCYHSSNGSVNELFGQIYNILWNSLSKKKVSTLICEVVTVVLNHIIGLLSKARAHISQKLHEEFLWQLCKTKIDSLCRAAYHIWLRS